MEKEDEEIETKISWWWYTVRSGGHAKCNDLFFFKKIKWLRLKKCIDVYGGPSTKLAHLIHLG
jgi:hypothetical protein